MICFTSSLIKQLYHFATDQDAPRPYLPPPVARAKLLPKCIHRICLNLFKGVLKFISFLLPKKTSVGYSLCS